MALDVLSLSWLLLEQVIDGKQCSVFIEFEELPVHKR